MAFLVDPPTTPNRALATAIHRRDVAGVRAALVKGASPDTYLLSRRLPVLAQVAAWIANPAAQQGASLELDAIAQVLVDAGADLTISFRTQGGQQTLCALEYPAVRAHPRLGPMGLAQLRDKAASSTLRPDQAAQLFQACATSAPLDTQVRQVLLDAGQTMAYPPEWLKLAWASHGPVLLQHCLRSGMEVELSDLSHQLQENRIQAPPLAWWLGQLPAERRARLLAGAFGKYGLLALAERNTGEKTRAALWQQALACPVTMEVLSFPHRMDAYLVLAVRQKPWVADRFVAFARDRGMPLDTVRGASACDAFADLFDPKAFSMASHHPPREAGLLECHLHRHGPRASAATCRKLVAAGTRPGFRDLVALLACVSLPVRRCPLARLFEQWVAAGVDPEPPEGPAAWECLPPGHPPAITQELRAWCRTWRLEHALESPTVRQARARM